MRKLLLAVAVLMLPFVANAQFKDTFDSNKLGWTEISSKNGEALIVDGKMHLEGKDAPFLETHCYAPLDFKKDFEIKCDAFVKKISDNGEFGIILNYIDDGNFALFSITEGKAAYGRYKDRIRVGGFMQDVKLKSQKKADLNLQIKSSYQKLEFFINNMKALEVRYLPLESTGVGFYIRGQQTIDFDNLEIIQ